jgi:hypothetical protein
MGQSIAIDESRSNVKPKDRSTMVTAAGIAAPEYSAVRPEALPEAAS